MKRFLILFMSLSLFAVPQPTTIPEDAYGVWQVPSIGTSTPVYLSDTYTGQEVVDEDNAALIRERGKGWEIGDHADSEVDGGVWNVNEMKVGEPAFLITEDGTYCYTCIGICIVWNNGFDYLLGNVRIKPMQDKDIIALSCTPIDEFEYLAYYQYTGVIPADF